MYYTLQVVDDHVIGKKKRQIGRWGGIGFEQAEAGGGGGGGAEQRGGRRVLERERKRDHMLMAHQRLSFLARLKALSAGL